MSRNIVETVIGFLVLMAAGMFVLIAYESGSISASRINGYTISAEFTRADGIEVGSNVEMSGVKIGTVTSLSLDPKTYNALVKMVVSDLYKLPLDSSAEILGDGLLGDKYISLSPGSDTKVLENGGRIEFTQPSISLESLIGKFIFGAASSKTKTDCNSGKS